MTSSPLPAIGSRIRQDFGPGNRNTWRLAGTVRAIVDGWIVLRRYSSGRGHYLELISPEKWEVYSPRYVVTEKRKRTEKTE